MSDFRDEALIGKVKEIERRIQENVGKSDDLKQVVDELKEVIQFMDKEMAIHSEKQSHLFFRIEQIQREIEVVEGRGDKATDRHRDLLENALMVIVGGVLTYLFSMAKS